MTYIPHHERYSVFYYTKYGSGSGCDGPLTKQEANADAETRRTADPTRIFKVAPSNSVMEDVFKGINVNTGRRQGAR